MGLVVILCLFATLLHPAASEAAGKVFTPLRDYLINAGFSAQKVDALFKHKSVRFEAKLLSSLLARPEKTLNYKQFLTASNVRRARRFRKKHAVSLRNNQKRTGVRPGVVVAILSVESGLGSYTGRYSVFNALASQAVLDTKPARRLLERKWPKKQKKYLHSPSMDARLNKRAAWARGEVAGLLILSKKQGVSPLSYKGSIAGALGMCQFVPTSVLEHGKDADGNGRIELHKAVDAIGSVGEYLSNHGWKSGLSRKKKVEVLLTYNQSRPYANTVLDLARKLK